MPERTDFTSDATPELVLGVDGGGSRCTAVLATRKADGIHELGRGDGGPANAGTVGFDEAAGNIAAAVAAAFVSARRPAERVAAACLGLAGAGRDEVRERWLAWAREQLLADRIDVVPDGVPAFRGDGAHPWGLLVIAGTGSVVWGRSQAGNLERCGGRGGIVGDEGSGWAIALAGLRATVRSADGWGPPTRLADMALARFEAESAADLPAALTRPETTRGKIAAFAADVVAAAEGGDAPANRILDEAAGDLGRQAAEVSRRLDFRSGEVPLRVAGGLLCRATLLRDGLVAWLTAAGLRPAVVIVADDLAAAAARTAAMCGP